MDCRADTVVGAASAQIARHCPVDILVAWLRCGSQQRRCRHQLTRLAISTLRNIMINPGLLQCAQGAFGGSETLNGGDLHVSGSADRCHTRPCSVTVEVYGTSAALGDAT